jgi:hypothetical protein
VGDEADAGSEGEGGGLGVVVVNSRRSHVSQKSRKVVVASFSRT